VVLEVQQVGLDLLLLVQVPRGVELDVSFSNGGSSNRSFAVSAAESDFAITSSNSTWRTPQKVLRELHAPLC
jgi:hypothetical protein